MAGDKPICSIEGCGKAQYGLKPWCEAHYRRWLAHDDPLGAAAARAKLAPVLPPDMKYCSRCKATKTLSEFQKDRSQKDGHSRNCTQCRRQYGKRWYDNLQDGGKGRRQRRRAAQAVWQADYYRAHKEEYREYQRAWTEANREIVRERQRMTMRRRRSVAKLRLESNVARAVHRALKGAKGRQPSFALLGFTSEQLMVHLERQFTAGMSWDNYGKWHVDHVLPLASFSYEKPTDPDFKVAWALTNLRPLWATENISKGARRLLLV